LGIGREGGGGFNRPATNFPGISVDSNPFNCLVEKSGLGIEKRRLLSPKIGFPMVEHLKQEKPFI
jgi:hypothetical protein